MVISESFAEAARGTGNGGRSVRAGVVPEHAVVIGMRVDRTSPREVADGIFSRRGESVSVCHSNVHMAIETYDSPSFRECVNSAAFVVPDGLPLLWAQRLLGIKGGEQVRGTTLMELLCEESAQKGWRVGLYGSTQEVLTLLVKKLQERYRGLDLSYVYSPPFRALTDEEDREVVARIGEAKVDILFVGIGCPRQERWMAEHRGRVRCAMLGVGAAFDFLAGKKKEAPQWMQRTGLEWLYRLLSEPRRLWKRYLVTNTRFVWLFSLQLVAPRRV